MDFSVIHVFHGLHQVTVALRDSNASVKPTSWSLYRAWVLSNSLENGPSQMERSTLAVKSNIQSQTISDQSRADVTILLSPAMIPEPDDDPWRRGIYRSNAQRLSISLAPLVAQRSLLFRVKTDLAGAGKEGVQSYDEVSTYIVCNSKRILTVTS